MDTVADGPCSDYLFRDQDEARDAFMRHVDERHPDCRASLCTPAGIALAGKLADIELRAYAPGWQRSGESETEWRSAKDALRTHLDNWAARWRLIAVPENVSRQHLTVPEWRQLSQAQRARWRGSSTSHSWVVGIAETTLRNYAISQRFGEPLPTAFHPLSPNRDWQEREVPGLPGWRFYDLPYLNNVNAFLARLEHHPMSWNPRSEVRPDAKARLVKQLDAALDDIERRHNAEYIRVPRKHLDWLVRYQIGTQAHAVIARSEGHDSHTSVLRAVNAVAEFIGLEPRDGKLRNRNRLGKLKNPNRVIHPRKPNTKPL